MSLLLRLMQIHHNAAKLIEINTAFENQIKEFMLDSTIPIMEKVELTDWLEKEGLGDYV